MQVCSRLLNFLWFTDKWLACKKPLCLFEFWQEKEEKTGLTARAKELKKYQVGISCSSCLMSFALPELSFAKWRKFHRDDIIAQSNNRLIKSLVSLLHHIFDSRWQTKNFYWIHSWSTPRLIWMQGCCEDWFRGRIKCREYWPPILLLQGKHWFPLIMPWSSFSQPHYWGWT